MTTIREDPLNLVIAGVGGQGNILLSRMVGRALVKKGYFVSIGETFGAAQRGGAVNSSIRISANMPLSPLIRKGQVHVVLGLEPMETLRILTQYRNPEAVSLTNVHALPPLAVLSLKAQYPEPGRLQQMIRELSASAFFLNATDIGLMLGAPIVANIVMLGALTAKNLLPLKEQEIEDEIRHDFAGDRARLNVEAFRQGIEAVQ